MAYTFDQVFAADPSNPSNVAANSSVLIFAPGDAAKTPLTITTTDGQPLANPIMVNANGFGPAFMHATLDRVAWSGGGFTGFFTSYEGMKDEAVAARTAADAAAVDAANSASLVDAPADTAVETLIKGTGTATRAALNADYARTREYDVRNYGTFTTASDAATNAAALQAANNACATFGGGRVVIPPGTYDAVGVIQDSRVEFHGPGATLRHPDGDGTDIIRSRTYLTTGSISAGSDSLTVASAAGIQVGSVIGIRAADGYSTIQFTTLTAGIDATQTTGITLTSSTGFPISGHMVVGAEVIGYTGITTGELTGVTRGVYGTTAATHAAGANIGTAARLVAEVTAVTGTTITLDRASDLTLTDTPVTVGVLHPAIRGLRFDGNRPIGGAAATTNPIRWDLARFGKIKDIEVVRGESAFYLAQGTRDCLIDGVTAHDCSVPEASKGAVFWLFQQCHRNTLNNLTVTGDMWSGVYLDNRTSTATEWDGPNDGNQGSAWTFSVKAHSPWITNTALNIVGGNQNTFSGITTRNVRTGFLIEDATQVYTADGSKPGAKGNHIDRFKMFAGYQPHVIDTPGNLITGLTYESAANGTNAGGSLIMASAVSPGGAPILGNFPDGTQTAPGIAFGSETNTGFYKIAAGQVQFVSQGTLVARLRSTGVMWADGKNLEFGTMTGSMFGTAATQKLGFWGKTPGVRPAALTAPDASTVDATYGTEEAAVINNLRTRLNELEARLSSTGILP